MYLSLFLFLPIYLHKKVAIENLVFFSLLATSDRREKKKKEKRKEEQEIGVDFHFVRMRCISFYVYLFTFLLLPVSSRYSLSITPLLVLAQTSLSSSKDTRLSNSISKLNINLSPHYFVRQMKGKFFNLSNYSASTSSFLSRNFKEKRNKDNVVDFSSVKMTEKILRKKQYKEEEDGQKRKRERNNKKKRGSAKDARSSINMKSSNSRKGRKLQPLTPAPTIGFDVDIPNPPTPAPSPRPTISPSANPTYFPTLYPTYQPSASPSWHPTQFPTIEPSALPTILPTNAPTQFPTIEPTALPTVVPTNTPTQFPTQFPTGYPTSVPTTYPTGIPTSYPSQQPTPSPTPYPTFEPTPNPTPLPTPAPDTFVEMNITIPIDSITLVSASVFNENIHRALLIKDSLSLSMKLIRRSNIGRIWATGGKGELQNDPRNSPSESADDSTPSEVFSSVSSLSSSSSLTLSSSSSSSSSSPSPSSSSPSSSVSASIVDQIDINNRYQRKTKVLDKDDTFQNYWSLNIDDDELLDVYYERVLTRVYSPSISQKVNKARSQSRNLQGSSLHSLGGDDRIVSQQILFIHITVVHILEETSFDNPEELFLQITKELNQIVSDGTLSMNIQKLAIEFKINDMEDVTVLRNIYEAPDVFGVDGIKIPANNLNDVNAENSVSYSTSVVVATGLLSIMVIFYLFKYSYKKSKAYLDARKHHMKLMEENSSTGAEHALLVENDAEEMELSDEEGQSKNINISKIKTKKNRRNASEDKEERSFIENDVTPFIALPSNESLVFYNDDFSNENEDIDSISLSENSDNQSYSSSDTDWSSKASLNSIGKKSKASYTESEQLQNEDASGEYKRNSEEEENSEEEYLEEEKFFGINENNSQNGEGDIELGVNSESLGIDGESANVNTSLESLYYSNSTYNTLYEEYRATALLSPRVSTDLQTNNQI